MASLAALLDDLYETQVIDTADVARVTGTHARRVNRWHTAKTDPGESPRSDSSSSRRWSTCSDGSCATTQLACGCDLPTRT